MRKLFGKGQREEAASPDLKVTSEAKVDIPLDKASFFSPPASIVLVTTISADNKPNILTVGMYTWISYNPPKLVIGVAPERYSYKLIEETKEFVVNAPAPNIMKQAILVGRVSGSDHDKFKETGLTPVPASVVKPPLIKECVSNIECKVEASYMCGDHKLYVGEIVAVHANAGLSRVGTYIQKYPPYQ